MSKERGWKILEEEGHRQREQQVQRPQGENVLDVRKDLPGGQPGQGSESQEGAMGEESEKEPANGRPSDFVRSEMGAIEWFRAEECVV